MKGSTPYVALCCLSLFVGIEAQTEPVQNGAMSCILNTETNIMTATMAIFKKTSIVTRAFFTKLDSYDIEYNQAGCVWSGTGTDENPFKSTVEVDSLTNMPPTGKNGCGYEIVDIQEQIYRWTVYNQIQNEYGREGDVVFIFECTGKNTPTSGTVTVQLAAQDKVGEAVRVRPENQMSVLERFGNSDVFGQVVTNGIHVGQDIKLRVQTKVKNQQTRQASIDHYGIFVYSCDYRIEENAPPVQFIQINGCPNSIFNDLGGGFKFAQNAPASAANTRWFQTETDMFKLVPTDVPDNSFYLLRCYVAYCYGPEGSDNRCQDYCNSNIRRRRSFNGTVESITIKVKVNKNVNVSNGNEKQTDSDEADIMVILATTIAMMVFFLVIAVGVICCCRRYRRKPETDWKDTSTTSSNKNILPDYPTNYYPAYPINNPKF
ncbi:uncharacterized protein LOC132724999 [Ruditapes philippinarum]|uniref:uncharacterized protein LOC132724999 n=1 Tax=Ruditapes philippinarum TaxID=129788 RepID=UPI00295C1D2A|nr:uncharacterized protein LOC132724999 [Ruditapes philippinarum]